MSTEADEDIQAWNTGPLLSDSCGYIALDHNAAPHGRIVVAFRGTYSIANTIVDLTTVPQEYVPYPGDPHSDDGSDTPHHGKKRGAKWWDWIHGIVAHPRSCVEAMDRWSSGLSEEHREHCQYLMNENKDRHAAEAVARRELRWQAYANKTPPKCENCTVHMGFLSSWQNTREVVLSQIILAKKKYPQYTVHLVGHSLGGAVAALAGLELEVKGYDPVVTTFGEPRIGNSHLRDYLDMVFDLDTPLEAQRYRRITHVDDPVPLLPLTEWGYKMHAGEVYIGKKHLSPSLEDLRLCEGDEDTSCIAGAETDHKSASSKYTLYDEYDVLHPNFSEACYDEGTTSGKKSVMLEDEDRLVAEYYGFRTKWGLPARMKMWQLFFAHRDYFWRLGLCVPGGDPRGWLGRTPTYVAGYGGEEERVGDEM